MHSFIYGILGGILIGLSAALLVTLNGDVLGASGIVSSCFLQPLTSVKDPCSHWKYVLLSAFALTGHLFYTDIYEDKDNGLAGISPLAFAIGGFLVGFGTKLGNGCTSGHGICGLARFSKRSFVAVGTFMTIGIVTAYLTQYETTPFSKKVFDFLRDDKEDPIEIWDEAAAIIIFLFTLVAFTAPAFHSDPTSDCRTKLPAAAVAGVLFAAGLYISRMTFPTVVLGFLNLGLLEKGGENWDPTLMFVMGGGATVSFLSYQFVEGHNVLRIFNPISKPLALSEGSNFSVPTNTVIDKDLVIGALLFGAGWGICGLCPGPALFLASIGVSWVLVCYWPAFFFGSYLASLVKSRSQCNVQEVPPCQSSEDQAGECQEGTKTYGSTRAFDVESGSDSA